jgi:hypothetical protein
MKGEDIPLAKFIISLRSNHLIAAGYMDGSKWFYAHLPSHHNLITLAGVKLHVHGSGELVASRTSAPES